MKKLTNKDRLKAIFLSADEAEARMLLEMAQLIVEMRLPVHEKPATKRGRPPRKVETPLAVAGGTV